MGKDTIIGLIIAACGGLFTLYKFIQSQRQADKEREGQLSLNVASQHVQLEIKKIEATATHNDFLSRGQQAFAQTLIDDSNRIREIIKQLEADKLSDLQIISTKAKENLELEGLVKKRDLRILELETELEEKDIDFKTLMVTKVSLETDRLSLNAEISRLNAELNRLNDELGRIARGDKR